MAKVTPATRALDALGVAYQFTPMTTKPARMSADAPPPRSASSLSAC
ncbi:MAG: hypothetical protein R3C52_14515 [Hyphomonadaceae bacterium]